jgi:hypothetical protein
MGYSIVMKNAPNNTIIKIGDVVDAEELAISVTGIL